MIRDDVREYQIVAPCKEDDHSIQIRTGNNGTVFFGEDVPVGIFEDFLIRME